MRQHTLFILHGALLFMAFFLLSSCAVTQSNVGKTTIKSQRLAIENEIESPRVWQTNEVSIQYAITPAPDSISLSGSIHIKDAITSSFPLADFFLLYLNILDSSGNVLETHDISPNIGYRRPFTDHVAISATLLKPPQASSIAFSYHGLFRGTTSREYSGDWEIFFSPFEKTGK